MKSPVRDMPGLPGLPRMDKGSARLPRLPGLAGPRSAAAARPRVPFGIPSSVVEEKPPWRRMPDWWPGSDAEWAIYWAHGYADPQRGEEGILWRYQFPLFGQFLPAGFVPDFSEYDLYITINVNEENTDPSLERLRSIILESLRPPFLHVIIDEEDALSRPIWVLNEALAGRSHSVIEL